MLVTLGGTTSEASNPINSSLSPFLLVSLSLSLTHTDTCSLQSFPPLLIGDCITEHATACAQCLNFVFICWGSAPGLKILSLKKQEPGLNAEVGGGIAGGRPIGVAAPPLLGLGRGLVKNCRFTAKYRSSAGIVVHNLCPSWALNPNPNSMQPLSSFRSSSVKSSSFFLCSWRRRLSHALFRGTSYIETCLDSDLF